MGFVSKLSANHHVPATLAWLAGLCGLLLVAEVFLLLDFWHADSTAKDLRVLEVASTLISGQIAEKRQRLEQLGTVLGAEPDKSDYWLNALLADSLGAFSTDPYGFVLPGGRSPPAGTDRFVARALQDDVLITAAEPPARYILGTRPEGFSGKWLFAEFSLEPLQMILQRLMPSHNQLRIRIPEGDWIVDADGLGDAHRMDRPPASVLSNRPVANTPWLLELVPPSPSQGGFHRGYRWLALTLLLLLAALQLTVVLRIRNLRNSQKGLQADLEDARRSLDLARTQLLQSESLASLGSQVAGVAHEVNTPIGIGLTAATHMQDEVSTIEQRLAERQIRKSELTAFLKSAREATEIMVSNMQRASDLIQSFKRVAIDQTKEGKRRFDLKTYLEEVLLSLRPRLRKVPQKVQVACDQAIAMYSYPGALSQIVTNLVSNALLHAYEPDEPGTIAISATMEGDRVMLRFSDDGKGIPQEHIDKLFEPFFTTAADRGGTGLGLHVVYNLVTRRLGGEIRCESRPGQGTVFSMRIPVDPDNTK
ncbi:MAG: HAMP domain-containing histidine kinase [Chromatiales bacterium]|nr:HAMP domain-containing histidine kinase [Chromatiales bacterium]